jgi:hypothetical protein
MLVRGNMVLERTARLLVDGSSREELYQRLRALHVILLVVVLEGHNILDGK